MALTFSYKTVCSAHGLQDRGDHVFCFGCGTLVPCPVGEETTGKACPTCKGTDLRRMCQQCVVHFQARGGRVPIERKRPGGGGPAS